MAAEHVRVTPGTGARVRSLREGRGWTVEAAAARAGLPAAEWEAFEQGMPVPADAYRAVLHLWGFTPHSMAFIERAGRGKELP